MICVSVEYMVFLIDLKGQLLTLIYWGDTSLKFSLVCKNLNQKKLQNPLKIQCFSLTNNFTVLHLCSLTFNSSIDPESL